MLPLLRHPLLVLSLAVIAVGAMALRSAFTLQELSGLRGAVSQSTNRLLTMDHLWSSVQDAESGQRGYLLTGDLEYLEPYEIALRGVQATRTLLSDLYLDSPECLPLITEIGAQLDERLLEMSSTLSVFRAHGRAPALAIVRADTGRRSMERLRTAVEQLRETERSALATRGETVKRQVDRALVQTAATLASVVAIMLLAIWLQRRESRARVLAQRGEYEAMRRLRITHDDLERSHESFVRSLREALFEFDVATRTIHWRADFESVTGDPPARFGTSVSDWTRRLHPDEAPGVVAVARRALQAGEMIDVEYRLLHADGTWRWVNVRGVPQQGADGRVQRLIGTMRDVTPLHEARSRLELALWAADIALWKIDVDTQRYEVSHAWARQLGYTTEEAPVSRAAWADLIHPDDRQRVLDHVRAVDERRIDRYDIELRLRHRDGSYRWFLSRGTPQLDAWGRVRHVIGARIDITAARESQAELEQSRTRLRSYAIALDHALELERSRIAREIHDELGQAMTGLKLDLGWLDRRLAALGTDGLAIEPLHARIAEMQAFLDTSIGAVRRIASELRPPLLDSAGLAAALEAQAQAFCRRAGLRLQLDVDPGLALAGDAATALFRIAQEAFTNIARHAAATRVEVSLQQAGDLVRMTLADDGRGLGPEEGRTPRHAGLGLLGIEERARLAGGSAWIEDNPGGGTRVVAQLPHEALRGQARAAPSAGTGADDAANEAVDGGQVPVDAAPRDARKGRA